MTLAEKPFKPHLDPWTPHWSTERVCLTIPGMPGATRGYGKPACRASVHGGGRHVTFHQCCQPGKIQDAGGFWWCGTHSPEAEQRRRDKARAKWAATQAGWDARDKADADRRSKLANADRYEAALRQIAGGHNDPRSLALAALESQSQ